MMVKYYDKLLILFLLVTLNYSYLSFNIDCYYFKANTILNNLTACLIFIKYHIYNFRDSIDKTFFKALFSDSNLYQLFLISIHFFLAWKLVSILSFIKWQLYFTFFTMSMSGIFRKTFISFLRPFRGKLTLTLIFNLCIKDFVHFVIMFYFFTFIFLKT